MLRIGYLDEAAPAEFLGARVEELARIIASNAMRGMKHAQRDRAQQARRSRRRPPHRESLHGDKGAGRRHRPCREATAAVLRRGPPSGITAALAARRELELMRAAARPTVLPIRILQLSPAEHLHLSPYYAEEQNIRLAVASFWSFVC